MTGQNLQSFPIFCHGTPRHWQAILLQTPHDLLVAQRTARILLMDQPSNHVLHAGAADHRSVRRGVS